MEIDRPAPHAQSEPGASAILIPSGLVAHEVAAGVGGTGSDESPAAGTVPAAARSDIVAAGVSAEEVREAADLFGLNGVVSQDYFMIAEGDLSSPKEGGGSSPSHSEATQEDAEARRSPMAEDWHAVEAPEAQALAQPQPAEDGPFELV